MGYSHRTWCCPFYRSDRKIKINCEPGSVIFPAHRDLSRFAKRYCGSVDGWRDCTLAKEKEREYEEKRLETGGVLPPDL